jgi:hypothetical protein
MAAAILRLGWLKAQLNTVAVCNPARLDTLGRLNGSSLAEGISVKMSATQSLRRVTLAGKAVDDPLSVSVMLEDQVRPELLQQIGCSG